jgi:dephospho-CoA kinase
MRRDGSDEEAASSRLNSQMPIDEKATYADEVIDNSGDRAELEKKVETLALKLKSGQGYILSWLCPPVGIAFAAATLAWRWWTSRGKGKTA